MSADIAHVIHVLVTLRDTIDEEAWHLRKAVEASTVAARRILPVVEELDALVLSADVAIQQMSAVQAAMENISDRESRYQRMAGRWRILAMQAILGEKDRRELLHAAFMDCIAEPPPQDVLDEELSRLTGRLEEMDAAIEAGVDREIRL